MILLTEDNARPSRDDWPRKDGRVLADHGGQMVQCYSPSNLPNYLGAGFSAPQWKARNQARGAGLRPDLAIMASVLDVQADRAELDRLVEEMEEAGGSKAAANRGTAMHSAIRRLLRGYALDEIDHDPVMADDLAAIASCIDAWGIELVDEWDERSLFNGAMPALGQCDALVYCTKIDPTRTQVFVLDLKTGSIKPLDCAIQLSCYAGATHEATLVDGAVQLEALPFDIRTDIGLVLHAPSGKADARIVVLDLVEGRRLAELAIAAHRETLDSGRVVIKDVGSRPVPSGHEEPAIEAAPIAEKDAGQEPARAETATASPRDFILYPDLTLHARVGLLRRRAKILVEQGLLTGDEATKMLADTGVPPLTKPDDQTPDTLDVWEGFIATIEMGLSTYGRTDEYLRRLKALPVDLLAHAEMRAKELDPPVPNLTAGQVTGPDLDRLEAVLAPIELAHAERVATVQRHLMELDSLDDFDAIVQWATEDRDQPTNVITSLDNLEAERVIALCATYRIDDLEAAIRNIGTAAEAKAIAKTVTERHQIPMPTSARAIASDRVLAGLVLTHNNAEEATK